MHIQFEECLFSNPALNDGDDEFNYHLEFESYEDQVAHNDAMNDEHFSKAVATYIGSKHSSGTNILIVFDSLSLLSFD